MHIITEPEIYIVGRQTIDSEAVQRFLTDHETSWETDSERGSELIVELAGRACYMSFGSHQFRKTNADYINNLVGQGHGSVLEHAVWDLLITGVSRSFTHELVRHRAGTAFSQLSQRYVDESTADFVEPGIIAADPELHATWLAAIESMHESYKTLVEKLAAKVQAEHPGPGADGAHEDGPRGGAQRAAECDRDQADVLRQRPRATLDHDAARRRGRGAGDSPFRGQAGAGDARGSAGLVR